MHEFKYRNNELFCEQVKLSRIAKRWGTPVYIYSRKTLVDHFLKIKQAFKSVNPLICFSVKANSNLALLKLLAAQGAGMDVVSGGELYRALRAGVVSRKIVYAGVGKSEQEIAAAIKAKILFFNAESVAELDIIERSAAGLGRKVNVCLRLNPDINAHTHKFITTGKKINKFGLDIASCAEVFLHSSAFAHINLIGLHIHIGSQISDAQPYVLAIKKALSLIRRLSKKDMCLKYLNIGGGLGIVYHNERPQSAERFAQAILPLLKATGLKLILEPGRFIAGNSGILLTKVLYIKNTAYKNFAIVDAGMNDLMRPSLYGAYHQILPVKCLPKHKKRTNKYDIVGPICETTDFLGKDRTLQPLQAQDLLAIMGAGAYGFVMSSNYNSRPRVAEVLVDQDRFQLVRKRENYSDLTRLENTPRSR